MLSSAGRKLNPIEKEAEKRAYAEWTKELNTKKITIMGIALLGVIVLACFLIQKHTNIPADSLILQILGGLVFSAIIILYSLYSRHALKTRKKRHYLEILKTGSYTDKTSSSPDVLNKKKSLEEIHKSFLKKSEEGKTKWNWAIFTPIVLLFIIDSLSTKYQNIDPYMKRTTLLFLSISCFGWLMSLITNARKGIVSIRGRYVSTSWIRKKERPILFHIILIFKCGVASSGFIFMIFMLCLSFFN